MNITTAKLRSLIKLIEWEIHRRQLAAEERSTEQHQQIKRALTPQRS
jgi:hypothetical protein